MTAASLGKTMTEERADVRRMFEIIALASRQLADIIDVMEQQSKQGATIIPAKVDLSAFLQHQFRFFEFDRKMRYGIRLQFSPPRNNIEVLVVPADLVLILNNLLHTIFNATEGGGTIDLECSISLPDTGPELQLTIGFPDPVENKSALLVERLRQTWSDLEPLASRNGITFYQSGESPYIVRLSFSAVED